MGLTMKQILNRFDDCDVFSLTGSTSRYNITIPEDEYEKQIKNMNQVEVHQFLEQFYEEYNITEEEFLNALAKVEERSKEGKRNFYENSKEKFVNYPEFDKLYEEIKQECNDFDCEENRQIYINKYYSNKDIEHYKKMGMTEEEINKKLERFFKCNFIVDLVGDKTKYGKENKGFFWNLYHDIATNIERLKDKDIYCINSGKSPLEQIPAELKEHFLYYEVSFFNSVTISSGLMINYYFKLNDETKKYLLKFRNDFYIDELEDLALYKDGKVKFYSCTHEAFNSIEFDYKNMSLEEIIDFINDEYFEENNNIIIEIVKKLINMKVGTKFSFKEFHIDNKELMDKICNVCDKLHLQLISSENKEHSYATITEDLNFKKIEELPAILCDVDNMIEKRY